MSRSDGYIDPMSELPVLYSFRRCPYAMRARLALLASGIPVELREVMLRDKAPEFLAVSPSATVPCLVTTSGDVVDESYDIMQWALSRNDPEGWLEPDDGDIDDAIALIEDIDGPFKLHLDRYKYDTRYIDVSKKTERSAAAAYLMPLDERLAAGKWLLGARPSLADYSILPFVRQFANTDRDWFEAEDWPHLIGWLKAFETSQRFAEIMAKYDKWYAGDEPITFEPLARVPSI